MVNYFLVSVVLFIFWFRARTEKCLMYWKPRPGREWHAIACTHAHTCHILFSCVIMAHLGLLNEKIAHIKYSFQIKSIPLWNIPFRYFWIYQLSYEFDNWLLNPLKNTETSNKIQFLFQLYLFASECHQKVVVIFFVTSL